MDTGKKTNIDRVDVLNLAYVNAGKYMGLTQKDLGQIIGKDQSTISRGSINPNAKDGELALLFIRAYRSLYAMVGGNKEQMEHWIRTFNYHTHGIPLEQVKTISGLTTVVNYLDAIRGKI